RQLAAAAGLRARRTGLQGADLDKGELTIQPRVLNSRQSNPRQRNRGTEAQMISRMVTAMVAAAFLASAAMAPTIVMAEAAKKELTPQQQKMKDCAAQWKEEKATKKVSGKKAHNDFMSKCLKKS